MVINYERGYINLMLDTEKVAYITVKKDKEGIFDTSVQIGLITGQTIDVPAFRDECWNLMRVLRRYMAMRPDYMATVNPFLKDKVRYTVSENAYKACKMLGIVTFEDLVKHTRQELLALPQIGKKSVNEFDEALEQRCLHFGYLQNDDDHETEV